MSFLNVKNVKHLVIAKDVARTANASIDPTSASYIAEGEIVVTTPGGTVLDATTVAGEKEIVLRQGRGGELEVISPVIFKDGASLKSQAYVPQEEESWTLGYDGTTGAFDEINDNLYLLNVDMKESSVFGFGQQKHKYGVYKSDANATQEEIVNGLTESLIANFSREPEQDVVFNMLLSDASVAVAPTANLVKDSDQVVFSAAHGLVAGDYIRIGTATTDIVYKVKAVTATDTLLLTTAYSGASVPAAVVTSIAANPAGNFGIIAQGQAREFKTGSLHYSKVRFELIPKDFGTTPVVQANGAIEGSGNYEQIAELEWATQGNEGNYYRSRSMAPVDEKRADVQKVGYDMITLKYEKTTHGGIGAKDVSPAEAVVAYPNGSSATSITDATDGIIAILDAFVA
jgi:hypothetical protein